MTVNLSMISSWVKERRQEIDISQKSLAEIIWCSPSYISDIECGRIRNFSGYGSSIAWRTVVRLADALSRDEDDRAEFLRLTGHQEEARFPRSRFPDIIQWREQFPQLVT